MTEVAWLIEHDTPAGPEWLMGNLLSAEWEWTRDANLALRFARQVDAEVVMTLFNFLKDCSATGHIWMDV